MSSDKMTRADLIDLHKRRVEACLEDYRLELLAYAEFMDDWRKRQVSHETGTAA
jgi:hypothetical protein